MELDDTLLRRQMEALDHPPIRYRFGVTKTIGEYVIAAPLARYLKAHPEISMDLTIANTVELDERLQSGDLQFALIEGAFDKADYESLLYASVPFVPVCRADHPFEKEPESLQDLLGETLLLREEGSGTRDIFVHALQSRNLQPEDFSRVIHVGGMHAILQMLEQDLGVSFLYRPAAKAYIDRGILRELDLTDFKIDHDFSFLWLRNSSYGETWKQIAKELQA